MLMLCGCIGKSGVAGLTMWVKKAQTTILLGTCCVWIDWHRPPRHMNGTSFLQSPSQWRHETVSAHEFAYLMPINRNFQSICSITTLKLSGQVGCHLPPIKPKSTDHCPQSKSQRHECSRLVVESLHNGSLRFCCRTTRQSAKFPTQYVYLAVKLTGFIR